MKTPKKPDAAKKNAKANTEASKAKAARDKKAKAKAKRDDAAADTTEAGVDKLANEVIANSERDSSMTAPDHNAETGDGRSTPAQSQEDIAHENPQANAVESQNENDVADSQADADNVESSDAEAAKSVKSDDDGSALEENILQTIISNIETAVAGGFIKNDCARAMVDAMVANGPRKQASDNPTIESTDDFVVIRVPIADLNPSGYGTSKKYLPSKLNEQRLNRDQGRALGRVLSGLFEKSKLKNGQLVSTKERAIRYILDLINDALPK